MRRILPGTLIVVLGCGPNLEPSEATTRTDSAGVQIVSNLRARSADSLWCVPTDPTLTIGSVDGAPEEVLFRVTTGVRARDGRIVLGEDGSKQLRVFGADGMQLLSFGREGEGPGEFRTITRAQMLGGTRVFVYDDQLGRGTVFRLDGTVQEVVVFEPYHAMDVPESVSPDSSGGYWALTQTENYSWPSQGLTRSPALLLRYSPSGEIITELAEVPGNELYVPADKSHILAADAPYQRRAFLASGGGSAYFGNNDSFAIERYGSEGQLELSIRYPPGEVRFEEVEEPATVSFRFRTGADTYERVVLSGPDAYPDTLPGFSKVFIDQNQLIWVNPYRDTAPWDGRWKVFGPDGGLRAFVKFPPNLSVLEVGGDYILGRTRDDLGVEFVQLYDVLKNGPHDRECF